MKRFLALADNKNITNDHMKDDELALDQSEKGNKSKASILYRASVLANMLTGSQDEYTRWNRLFDVWIERPLEDVKWSIPNFHAQNLGIRGEFLSLVWLLMAHLGGGSQYQVGKLESIVAPAVQSRKPQARAQ